MLSKPAHFFGRCLVAGFSSRGFSFSAFIITITPVIFRALHTTTTVRGSTVVIYYLCDSIPIRGDDCDVNKLQKFGITMMMLSIFLFILLSMTE